MAHRPHDPDTLDAYRTTGSSPGDRPLSVHLLGPGAVGREFLRLLTAEAGLRLVAASDRTGTVHDAAGLDPLAVADWKAQRGPLAEHPSALGSRGTHQARAGAGLDRIATDLERVGADLVVDATPTSFHRAGWADLLERTVRDRDASLILAAKDAPARAAHRWLHPEPARAAVGINAVLGGAGEALRAELAELREDCVDVALAGSASTTCILGVLEDGGSFDEGVCRARHLALLEPDPELDFQGRDAAVKLAVVVQALWGWQVAPDAIEAEDLRTLDPEGIRAHRARGGTTRLVARAARDGGLSVRYEQLAPGHPLAVPRSRVAYRYALEDGRARLHLGRGLGAPATARALLDDARRQVARRRIVSGEPGRADRAGGGRVEAPAPAAELPEACPSGRLTLGSDTRIAYLADDAPLTLDKRSAPGFVAFECVGPPEAPVVVALGGISADRHAAAAPGRPGWWADQVGPGRALDTERVRVVSIDWLGGNGGSWGPRSAPSWPTDCIVTTDDQARAVAAVLDSLGVVRADLVVGASYGGKVALRLGVLEPDRVRRLCLLGAAHESHPMATAVRSLQRRVIRLAAASGRPSDGVALARGLGLTTYRSALEFAGRFGLDPEQDPGRPARFPVDDYLDARSKDFARDFHPDAYLCLSQSLDLHRSDPSELTVPATLVAFDTDTLVPPWSVRALALGASGRTRYLVVTTEYGHDGFLKEVGAVAEILRDEVVDVLGRGSAESPPLPTPVAQATVRPAGAGGGCGAVEVAS